MATVTSVDPRSGRVIEEVGPETSPAQLAEIAAAARRAAVPTEDLGRHGRARMLEAIAAALHAARDEIVAVADRETAIGPRLEMEVARTVGQLRMFAEVITDGGYLEAAIDHAVDTATPPAPDVRRMLVPLGPVAVFGASNFPLAFSVPGGDTVAALAAGNPVIVKAHESHPATSARVFEIMAAAAHAAGAPEGVLGIVYGRDAGAALVAHPAVRAVGFTGSLPAARALMSVIDSRPDPIPFYGELSSLNPVIVTAATAEARGEDVGRQLAASFTTSGGQLCTKPGVVFVPAGPAGDELVAALCAAAVAAGPATLLNGRIHESFGDYVEAAAGPFTVLADGGRVSPGFGATPVVLGISAADVDENLITECFGPITVVARYAAESEAAEAIRRLPASLTLTVHHESDDIDRLPALVRELREHAGRIVYNGLPTGVRVSWAQHHGGPWPATNALHTSVGATAIRRFLRPVAWQDAPMPLLPGELRDGAVTVPVRIDGRLRLPD